MASIPQGAFAAYKLRANKTTNNKDMTIARLTNGEEKQPPRYSNKKLLELGPVKYNDKLMNSIWGLYNLYSPHNFKKNNAEANSQYYLMQQHSVAVANDTISFNGDEMEKKSADKKITFINPKLENWEKLWKFPIF